MEFLRYIPKDYLSFMMGKLSSICVPDPFRMMLLRWFAGRYKIDVSEASRPLESYPSIADFFVRDLKDGIRPVESEIVSPVDGTLRGFGTAVAGSIEQIKGKEYSVLELLNDEQEALKFSGGYYFNLYLSPQDYHHVHSPVSGHIRKVTSIPGKLWPVNDWSIQSIDKLFAVNERIAIFLSTEHGDVVVVMVGATNVGKISLAFEPLVTNTAPWQTQKIRNILYNETQKPVGAAARLGTFHLGSSVLLLFSPTFKNNVSHHGLQKGQKVRFGQKVV